MYTTKEEGIVIRSYEYGDGHAVVVIYTRNSGKIRAVAKGSRKTKSKFGASLEPLSENHFLLHKKPAADLYTITGSKILRSHAKIRQAMSMFSYGALMAEGVDLMCADEDMDAGLYELLRSALNDIEIKDPPSTGWLFFFRLLKSAGYRLDFFKCNSCGTKDMSNMYFSPAAGGILCGACSQGADISWKISRDTLSGIRKLSTSENLHEEVESEIGNIVKKFIKYQFDKDLKSLRFLKLFKSGWREKQEAVVTG